MIPIGPEKWGNKSNRWEGWFSMKSRDAPTKPLIVGISKNGDPISIPFAARQHNFMALGMGGSVLTAMPLLKQDFADPDRGVILITTNPLTAWKGAIMAEEAGRTPCLFDPNLRYCPTFNPMAGEEREVANRMVNALQRSNPDLPPFFMNVDEFCLKNAILLLKRMDEHKSFNGYFSTLVYLSRFLENEKNCGVETTRLFLRTPAAASQEKAENAEIGAWFFTKYFNPSSYIYSGSSYLRSWLTSLCASKVLSRLLAPNVNGGEQSQVDFEAVSKNGGVLCLVLDPLALDGQATSLSMMVIGALADTVLKRKEGDKPLSIYLDSVDRLPFYPLLPVLEGGDRYHTATHLFLLTLDSLDIYNKRGFSKALINATQSYLVRRCSFKDAETLLRMFGERSATAKDLVYQNGLDVFVRVAKDYGPFHPTQATALTLSDKEMGRLERKAKERFCQLSIK